MRIPDYFAPIIGYRVWRVAKGGLLTGLFVQEPWVPRQQHHANCQAHSIRGSYLFGAVASEKPEVSPHFVDGEYVPVPAKACTCGVWAAKSEADVWRASGTNEREGAIAWGAVSLWGRMIEHETGWRAECAYPQRLHATAEAGDIARLYGVPCEPAAMESPNFIKTINAMFPPITLTFPVTISSHFMADDDVDDEADLTGVEKVKAQKRKNAKARRSFLDYKYQSKAVRRGFISEVKA